LKILYFSSHPHINMASPSGPGTHIREVIGAFERAGHTVIRQIAGGEELRDASTIQIKPRWWRKLIPTFVRETIKDYRLKQWDAWQFQTLDALIEREKPDLIYERGYYLMRSGLRAAKKHGVRHFLEINAPYPEEKASMSGRGLFHHKASSCERFQAEETNHLFVVSSALKDYYIQQHGIASDKITVTPNAVNADLFADQHIESMRGDLKISSASTVIGFVGSIFPYHGVDVLIRCFASIVQDSQQDLRLLIVGDGETLPALKDLAEQLNMRDQILFSGNIPHHRVMPYIQAMDICVMAKSNWYGSPVKIFEYGALGKAIVAPDVIPVRDVMQSGLHGLLVHDEQSLHDALKNLIQHHALREQLAAAFYHEVKTKYTWDHVATTILAHHR